MSFDRPILVTGAAGCIGAWVIAGLAERGAEPVAFDLSEDRRRLRLLLPDERANAVRWVKGDLGDTAAVDRAVGDSGAGAVIHLAALQIPFCKADPVAGARVNVVGQVNMFEAARKHGIRRLVYASSIAAMAPAGGDTPATLYGVYKKADEGIAKVYAQDWGVASIGLRPHSVYGPGRDQGVTSAPTKAMVAAIAGKPFTIPFTGALNFQFVGEVAEIFIRCAAAEIPRNESPVFDLQGSVTRVDEIIAEIRKLLPAAEIKADGPGLPFPATFDDGPLRRLVGSWPATSLQDGIGRSVAAFRDLLGRGLVNPSAN